MDGAAQKFIPLADNPGFLEIPQRKSKWKRGLERDGIENTSRIETTSRELRNLVSKGGRKGRINDAHRNWSFFPKSSVQNT